MSSNLRLFLTLFPFAICAQCATNHIMTLFYIAGFRENQFAFVTLGKCVRRLRDRAYQLGEESLRDKS